MSKNKKTILLNGALGRMGLAIIDELDRNFTNLQVLHAIENPNHPKINSLIGKKITIQKLPRKFSVDLIIDFSTPKSSINLAKIASQFRTPIVIGTTGFSKNQINQLISISKKIPILQSYNMSIGINIMLKIIKDNFEFFNSTDLEIIEKHHKQKVDSPSGTALLIAENIANLKNKKLTSIEKYRNKSANAKRSKHEVGISSIRGGNTVGEHTLISYGDTENITIKHEALSRSVFAKGAIELGLKLINKKKGFYSVIDLLN
tara:strand:+ start:47133 stop:47915 length:783 start_codon:yes stop_codon:yes gene_type:complete